MQAPELTLAAALRDATSPRPDARHKAIRSLAGAYLLEAGLQSPHFRAAQADPRGPQVVEALRAAQRADDPALAAVATVGLGMMGDPELLADVAAWVDDPAEGLHTLRRECAVVAVSYLGACAPQTGPDAGVRKRVTAQLEAWLRATQPDIRFQAVTALAEVQGTDAAPALLDVLHTETQTADPGERRRRALANRSTACRGAGRDAGHHRAGVPGSHRVRSRDGFSHRRATRRQGRSWSTRSPYVTSGTGPLKPSLSSVAPPPPTRLSGSTKSRPDG